MNTINWAPFSEQPIILKNAIHIWKIQFSDFSNQQEILRKALSTDEQKRATRFHFKIDKQRYLICKAFLKIILSRIMGIETAQVDFTFSEHGKPYLKDRSQIHFNISHSGDIGLIAITDVAPIGVDVEQHRDQMELKKIANRFFSKEEVAELMELPDESRLKGFFNCWSRKEAFIKAIGLGLAMPLEKFQVSLKPGEAAQLLSVNYKNEQASDWILKDLTIAHDYSAAYVVKSKEFKDFFWRIENLF
jgi:4'-phosphopantetheinyl transferase